MKTPDGSQRLSGAGDAARIPSPRPKTVDASAGESPAGLLAGGRLDVPRNRPVIVVCGRAEKAGGKGDLRGKDLARAGLVLGPAVAIAAKRTRAIVIDGGTAAGVMAVMGEARARTGGAISELIGVAPSGCVIRPGEEPADDRTALDEHHTHVVLAEGDQWGRETDLRIALAAALAGSERVAMVVGGGDELADAEIREATRRRWPVFAVGGTGGTADWLAKCWPKLRERRARKLAPVLPYPLRYRRRKALAAIDDPVRREILAHGDVRVHRDDDACALGGRIAWALQDDGALADAWRTFATYDELAGRLRKTFEHFQAAILGLGILATLLALLHETINGAALHWAVVAAPVMVSVLIALSNRRAAGKRWVLLRGAAESVKSELFRYRTGTGAYRDASKAASTLARRIDRIVERLMRTEASSGPLSPYVGPLPPRMYGSAADDDGLSRLTPERYLQVRVSSQLDYYHGRIRGLDRRRGQLQFVAIAAGGAGAILAAAGVEIWIGLTTTIAAAGLSYLGHLQVDPTIVAYNQAAARLKALRDKWEARTDEPSDDAFDALVDRGEAVLTTELGGWVEQMSQSLREVDEGQAERGATVDPGRDRTGAAAETTRTTSADSTPPIDGGARTSPTGAPERPNETPAAVAGAEPPEQAGETAAPAARTAERPEHADETAAPAAPTAERPEQADRTAAPDVVAEEPADEPGQTAAAAVPPGEPSTQR